MSKYNLYIRQYDITTNDYKVRKETIETNDIYHEIGKIYSTAFTEIKRIDYEKIDEVSKYKKVFNKLKEKINNHVIKESYYDTGNDLVPDDDLKGDLLKLLEEIE